MQWPLRLQLSKLQGDVAIHCLRLHSVNRHISQAAYNTYIQPWRYNPKIARTNMSTGIHQTNKLLQVLHLIKGRFSSSSFHGLRYSKSRRLFSLRWMVCRISATLMSVGSLFRHYWARRASSQDFVVWSLGSPHSEGVKSCSAVVKCSRHAGVYVSTVSRMWDGPEPFAAMANEYQWLELDLSSPR